MFAVADVTDRSISDLVSLAGRTAVVTGAGRGLGKAIALRLAEAGAAVLVADIDLELARAAAADIVARGQRRATGIFMDVADTASVRAAADLAVSTYGSLDIWVNNAGIFPSLRVAEMTDQVWDQVLDINTRGVFVGSREASVRMMAAGHGGVIVNIVSTAGFRGVAPGLSAYVSSKHAVCGLTKQMALELAPHGIRVLGVAPTYCVTEGNQIAASQNPDRANTAADIPAIANSRLGRVGVPDDIARAVLFCASDMSIFMTGSTLLADAGETI
ncbi:NAD(P)-dependent dehydrogenase (short-subunit alcohol dehydrogenase family) [Novosphingobium chloroacetimidivorans]|uniref:NAD(P)-dependent dehydrogenase (Short-subunit alcohol dehydrogenase family) n=1 Tax=Novosphingobium chloroacetimidivorans TaxID=1428314 RepID=A0A7W7K9V9_9SPHN|nr:SDR family oxidoreductase [Novosphingobium chloroacetimidivorans]MBB4858881.1 NAD(P)-dependent dehydrogenase (short-subunit alcohol dehydrogenase family) [Novosphingobium chloroacetimidivorans]